MYSLICQALAPHKQLQLKPKSQTTLTQIQSNINYNTLDTTPTNSKNKNPSLLVCCPTCTYKQRYSNYQCLV